MATKQITVEVEHITPEVAIDMLGHNTHNRRVRDSLVYKLANAMRRGEWVLNGETIKVRRDGVVIDGQHRLLAVIESGLPINTYVVRGLDDMAQQTVDIGQTRAAKDVLALEGYGNRSALLAATLRYLRMIETNEIRSSNAGSVTRAGARNARFVTGVYSPQELMETLLNYPYIYDSITKADAIVRPLRGSQSQYAALHAWFSTIDSPAADEFFDMVGTGLGLTATSPVYLLRKWMETRTVKDTRRVYTQSRIKRLYVHAMFVLAWNAWRDGKHPKNLSWKTTSDLPVPH